jgi:hypothetical protein
MTVTSSIVCGRAHPYIMSPKPCWRRNAFPESGKVVTGLGGCAQQGESAPAACCIARHCHGENTRRTSPDLAARLSALMVVCYLRFGTTWFPSRHRHFAWTPSDQPLPTRHGPYPNPAGHRGQDLLPAETNAGQGPQGSDAMPETAAVRRRLPTTAPRRGQTGGGPGRTLEGGSNVQRGQLKPRTLTLRTSHFPDPSAATIELREHHSY